MLTEDRIEYRVVVDGDMINEYSQIFDDEISADLCADHFRAYGHSVEIKTRHVTTTYSDWS